jgi:hypothetical protein
MGILFNDGFAQIKWDMVKVTSRITVGYHIGFKHPVRTLRVITMHHEIVNIQLYTVYMFQKKWTVLFQRRSGHVYPYL